MTPRSRPVIEGGYGVYGVLLLVWMGAVGWSLYRLGANRAPPHKRLAAGEQRRVDGARSAASAKLAAVRKELLS